VVACARSKEAVVIDPGADADKIVAQCQGLTVRHLLCSHGHRNHASAKDEVKAQVGGATALSLLDAKGYLRSADRYLSDADRLQFGDFEVEVIATPGHSPGSLCFKVANHLFDVDLSRQVVSVLSRLLTLPENTVVYPGHGPTTTVGQERRENVAVQMLRQVG
jgi:glyoxylase-like metal-dependent hydrolase (beta-lactamase superfamily II)